MGMETVSIYPMLSADRLDLDSGIENDERYYDLYFGKFDDDTRKYFFFKTSIYRHMVFEIKNNKYEEYTIFGGLFGYLGSFKGRFKAKDIYKSVNKAYNECYWRNRIDLWEKLVQEYLQFYENEKENNITVIIMSEIFNLSK